MDLWAVYTTGRVASGKARVFAAFVAARFQKVSYRADVTRLNATRLSGIGSVV
jgi:hypothetical protein